MHFYSVRCLNTSLHSKGEKIFTPILDLFLTRWPKGIPPPSTLMMFILKQTQKCFGPWESLLNKIQLLSNEVILPFPVFLPPLAPLSQLRFNLIAVHRSGASAKWIWASSLLDWKTTLWYGRKRIDSAGVPLSSPPLSFLVSKIYGWFSEQVGEIRVSPDDFDHWTSDENVDCPMCGTTIAECIGSRWEEQILWGNR